VDTGAYIVVLVISYFLGSVPAGFLAGKARGIDVRTVGSGNIGATNAFRVLGTAAGTVVLLADALKGFAAARWTPSLAVYLFPGAAAQRENLALAAGAAAILGHNFTCWLSFKGGKGIATSAGVLLATLGVIDQQKLLPTALAFPVGQLHTQHIAPPFPVDPDRHWHPRGSTASRRSSTLVQSIRDEAHRFAVTFHRSRRRTAGQSALCGAMRHWRPAPRCDWCAAAQERRCLGPTHK